MCKYDVKYLRHHLAKKSNFVSFFNWSFIKMAITVIFESAKRDF